MRVRAVLLAALGSVLLVPGAAAADGVQITQQLVDGDGWPSLVANQSPVGGQPVSWRVCAPDCGAVVSVGIGSFSPGPTAPGTTFEASTTVGGVTTTARSGTWTGRVTSATPPRIAGDARIGAAVVPLAGTWSGGWGDEFSDLGVVACPTAAGTGCRELTGRGFTFGSPSVAIDPAYAGWYVGAYEQRLGAGTVFPADASSPPRFGTVSPYALPAVSQTSVVGPLAGPVPAVRQGTPPRVTGRPAAGRTVTPRPGTWPDAPAGGRIRTGLRACPTRRDTTSCVLLVDPYGRPGRPGPGAAVRIARAQVGWYVGAVDVYARGDGSVVTPAFYDPATAPRGSAPGFGGLLGPLSKDPVGLGFTPRASIPRGVGSRATLRLATLRCGGPCVAHVTLRGGGRSIVRRVAARAGRPVVVSVRRSRFAPARAIRVVIRFDHVRGAIRRTVRVG